MFDFAESERRKSDLAKRNSDEAIARNNKRKETVHALKTSAVKYFEFKKLKVYIEGENDSVIFTSDGLGRIEIDVLDGEMFDVARRGTKGQTPFERLDHHKEEMTATQLTDLLVDWANGHA